MLCDFRPCLTWLYLQTLRGFRLLCESFFCTIYNTIYNTIKVSQWYVVQGSDTTMIP